MLAPYTFRSGWIELTASRIDPSGPPILIFCEHRTVRKPIFVPHAYRDQHGELRATVIRTGERLAIAEGTLRPHDDGLRMLSPDDSRISTFKVRLIRSLAKDLVELWFIPDGQ